MCALRFDRIKLNNFIVWQKQCLSYSLDQKRLTNLRCFPLGIDSGMATQLGKSVNHRAWLTPAKVRLPEEVYQLRIQLLMNYKAIFHSPSRASGH